MPENEELEEMVESLTRKKSASPWARQVKTPLSSAYEGPYIKVTHDEDMQRDLRSKRNPRHTVFVSPYLNPRPVNKKMVREHTRQSPDYISGPAAFQFAIVPPKGQKWRYETMTFPEGIKSLAELKKARNVIQSYHASPVIPQGYKTEDAVIMENVRGLKPKFPDILEPLPVPHRGKYMRRRMERLTISEASDSAEKRIRMMERKESRLKQGLSQPGPKIKYNKDAALPDQIKEWRDKFFVVKRRRALTAAEQDALDEIQRQQELIEDIREG